MDVRQRMMQSQIEKNKREEAKLKEAEKIAKATKLQDQPATQTASNDNIRPNARGKKHNYPNTREKKLTHTFAVNFEESQYQKLLEIKAKKGYANIGETIRKELFK